MTCDTVVTKASADLSKGPEAETTLQKHSELKQVVWISVHSSVIDWMPPALGERGQPQVRQLLSAKGDSQVGVWLGAIWKPTPLTPKK